MSSLLAKAGCCFQVLLSFYNHHFCIASTRFWNVLISTLNSHSVESLWWYFWEKKTSVLFHNDTSVISSPVSVMILYGMKTIWWLLCFPVDILEVVTRARFPLTLIMLPFMTFCIELRKWWYIGWGKVHCVITTLPYLTLKRMLNLVARLVWKKQAQSIVNRIGATRYS